MAAQLDFCTAELLIGIYSEKIKSCPVHPDAYKQKFPAAFLFFSSPNSKQSKCISTGEWMSKPWHIITVKLYSEKGRGLLKYTTAEMNPKKV